MIAPTPYIWFFDHYLTEMVPPLLIKMEMMIPIKIIVTTMCFLTSIDLQLATLHLITPPLLLCSHCYTFFQFFTTPPVFPLLALLITSLSQQQQRAQKQQQPRSTHHHRHRSAVVQEGTPSRWTNDNKSEMICLRNIIIFFAFLCTP